jgi:hypothetical protein
VGLADLQLRTLTPSPCQPIGNRQDLCGQLEMFVCSLIDVEESSSMSNAPESEKPEAAPEQARPQPIQLVVKDDDVVPCYANFCRVIGSPEELIVDFGLNPQPYGPPRDAIKVTQRLVINYFTAKRLLHALQLSVQRHEAAFGVLETDIQKRARPMQQG